MELDGGYLEGGGQIVRNGLALSCILKKQIKIVNIRANRDPPGLKHQHCAGVKLMTEISNSITEGCELQSKELVFVPQSLIGGDFEAPIGTAGSISLVIQCCLPSLIFAKNHSKVIISGGTNVIFSPPIDYLSNIFLPVMNRMNVKFGIEVIKRGYFPKGGGEVILSVEPVERILPIDLTTPAIYTCVQLILHVDTTIPFEKQIFWIDECKKIIKKTFTKKEKYKLETKTLFVEKSERKDHIAWIEFCAVTEENMRLSYSHILQDGKFKKEKVSETMWKLAECMRKGSTIDEYLQDQLIVYMALADGVSKIRCHSLTDHTKSAIYVAETLTTAKFSIESPTDEMNCITIKCDGGGVINKNCCSN